MLRGCSSWRYLSSTRNTRGYHTFKRVAGLDQKGDPRRPAHAAVESAAIAQPPSPANDKERQTRSRHLLRAILRECTYLPDSFSRGWIAKHVACRFKTYGFKAWQHRKDEDFNERLLKKEKEARKFLSMLRRANEGERESLLKVLYLAYGRTGRRRHELMRPLLSVDGQKVLDDQHDGETTDGLDMIDEPNEADAAMGLPPDPATIAQPHGAVLKPTAKRPEHALDLTPQLRALLESQIQAAPPGIRRSNPRRIDPQIPEFNAWLRPMPQKRIKNMKHKHYAQLLNRTQPPLPEDEWTRLRGLASGTLPLEAPIPRRTSIDRPNTGTGSTLPTSPLEMVAVYGKAPQSAFGNRRAHEITPRFMRRLYATVFSMCPLLKLDHSAERWTVIWGHRALQQCFGDLHSDNKSDGRLAPSNNIIDSLQHGQIPEPAEPSR